MSNKHFLLIVDKYCDDLEELINEEKTQNIQKKIDNLSNNINSHLKLFIDNYEYDDEESFNEMLKKTIKRFSFLTNSSNELYKEVLDEEFLQRISYEEILQSVFKNLMNDYLEKNVFDKSLVDKYFYNLYGILSEMFLRKDYERIYFKGFYIKITLWRDVKQSRKISYMGSSKLFLIYKQSKQVIIEFPSSDYFISIKYCDYNKSINVEEYVEEKSSKKKNNNCVIS